MPRADFFARMILSENRFPLFGIMLEMPAAGMTGDFEGRRE
jgi:hypothetical protein